jgi:uncharacterized DUF497 family protein
MSAEAISVVMNSHRSEGIRMISARLAEASERSEFEESR